MALRLKASLTRTACAAILWSVAIAAFAQAYPTKPIRIFVPFAAGGPVDLVGRVRTEKLTVYFRQPLVIDNRGIAAK